MYWLITYQQNTGRQYIMANAVTHLHPAEWLLKTECRDLAETVIIFAIEISEDHHNRIAVCSL